MTLALAGVAAVAMLSCARHAGATMRLGVRERPPPLVGGTAAVCP